jgi:hypothetical protein
MYSHTSDVDYPIKITITEPWEVLQTAGVQPLLGRLVKQENDNGVAYALIELDHSIIHNNIKWKYLVMTQRNTNNKPSTTPHGKRVEVNMIGVDRIDDQRPLGSVYTSWRGGLGIIGEIEST